ncbi:hypothetical protein FKP32DRAFT_1145263 [Trametes sanguinea]|nr:hypothetical protein FKP32DRAFT_1145263 [Trametes sanguinea]
MSGRRRWRLFGPALLRVVPRDRQTLAGRVPDSLQFLERFWEPTSFRTEGDDPWIWPTDRPPHLALRSHAVPMADHLPSSLRRARVLPPPWPCATCLVSPRSVSVRRAPWATVARERWQMRARPFILTLDLSLLSSRQERGLAWLFLIGTEPLEAGRLCRAWQAWILGGSLLARFRPCLAHAHQTGAPL